MSTPTPSAPAWTPTGPPVATVRFRLWTQAFAVVVMGAILLGLVIAVVDSVAAGDAGEPFRSSGISGGGVVVGWIIVVVIGGLLLMSVPLVVRFRLQVWPDGFVARAYVRRYTVGLDRIEAVEVQARRQNPLNPVAATAVLRVRARDVTGRRRGFALTRAYQVVDPVLPVVDEWLRRRPEIASASAREVFAARGVPFPAPPAPPPSPAAGPFRQVERP